MIVWVILASDGLICDVYSNPEAAGEALLKQWNTAWRWDDYSIKPWKVLDKYEPYMNGENDGRP